VTNNIGISSAEKDTLRRLAAMVRDIAAEPIQTDKRERWIAHNTLRSTDPMVLAIPEGAWLDCLPTDTIICHHSLARGWEKRLRMMIYLHDVICDDYVVEPYFNVGWMGGFSGFKIDNGAEPVSSGGEWTPENTYYIHPNHDNTLLSARFSGNIHSEPPLWEPDDLKYLKCDGYIIDKEETYKRVEMAAEIFGDLLPVRLHGWMWVTGGFAQTAVRLRGYDQLMLDIYDRPEWVHEFLSFLGRSVDESLVKLEESGCLSTNHEGDWIGTGGLGYTDELPADGFQPGKVRCRDIWGFAECQDLIGFSPDVVDEFFFPYILPSLSRFGLNHYGCCEPIHDKIHLLKKIPRLRRVSISPWCDIKKSAEGFGGTVIFSMKPNPSALSMSQMDDDEISAELISNLRITRANGCVVEILMKDLHSIQDPRRITRWVQLAREAVSKVYGG
jgi:hypothetical protein